ncbi:hypothetical protein DSM112329_00123 [Paraconexibacter sp. AEG42_29]|uniref:DUF541 domain-containing protein n=1 Tax=Paraconexibacter sp. AEG42_29 TaxID=2997339 RepID=A0AAU7ANR9_9ACTN
MRIPTVAALATTLALAAATAAPAVAAADDTAATLSINGTGVTMITPDVATISVEVRSGSANRVTARSRANIRTKSVLNALARQGVLRTAITTTGVELSRTQVNRKKVFYASSNTIVVRFTDIAKVGPSIDAVTKAGADTVDGPQLSFSDPSAGLAETTRAAIADARRRADDAAAAAGQRVTGVQSIVVDPYSVPEVAGGTSYDASAPAPKRGEPTQVVAGRQEATATVRMVFTIAPA